MKFVVSSFYKCVVVKFKEVKNAMSKHSTLLKSKSLSLYSVLFSCCDVLHDVRKYTYLRDSEEYYTLKNGTAIEIHRIIEQFSLAGTLKI